MLEIIYIFSPKVSISSSMLMPIKQQRREAEGDKRRQKEERNSEWVEENSWKERRADGRTEEVMEQKPIKLQSRGPGQPTERKHPCKHQQNGTTRLGIIHSVSSRGERGGKHSTGIWWDVPPSLFLSLS